MKRSERQEGTYITDHGFTVVTGFTDRASTFDRSLGDIALPVSKALCPSFDAFAITIGILLDAGEDVLVVGKVHLDLLAGCYEMNDVGRGELISNHDHELVLREDLNERGDGGLRLLEALEVESALVLGDCRSLFGTFRRHRDGSRCKLRPEWWLERRRRRMLQRNCLQSKMCSRGESYPVFKVQARSPGSRVWCCALRKELSASGCRVIPRTYHF
jgi:hypothetical protein